MHVVIIGGGIGGLALAHGLRRRGVEVSVHERDAEPASRWEGYRIHIDPLGHRALRACLPEPQWRAFLDTAGREGGITMLTERLEELVDMGFAPAGTDGSVTPDHHAVDRRVLRRILLSGLGDAVRRGAARSSSGTSRSPTGGSPPSSPTGGGSPATCSSAPTGRAPACAGSTSPTPDARPPAPSGSATRSTSTRPTARGCPT